jgi:hypothetical protein
MIGIYYLQAQVPKGFLAPAYGPQKVQGGFPEKIEPHAGIES